MATCREHTFFQSSFLSRTLTRAAGEKLLAEQKNSSLQRGKNAKADSVAFYARTN